MHSICHFAIHDESASEALGAMSLRNDGEAVSFGGGIIHDLMDGSAAQNYATCTMVVTEGERAVANIPFDSRIALGA